MQMSKRGFGSPGHKATKGRGWLVIWPVWGQCSVHHTHLRAFRKARGAGMMGGQPLHWASPGRIFFQQQLHKLPGHVQGEHALRHLLQDPQVVAVGGGEAVHAADGTTEH